ncbi:putative Isoflavone reductase like protein [Glarea lozoyensis 74030]|uniref:Putative Isoflavone reductase like protein n=1 Tax=Glarea lozoyensis (strain ATCC 74030 / MF5533) TaxID=1104152 RepID=H0ENY3_GLAL7|nr:putative Isoflavone reductase like protein [Glarea lozoyensis 74030]
MSQTTKENLLLFGATGYIGTYITEQIVANKSSFGKIALFTSANTVEKKTDVINKLKSASVEVIVGDASKKEDVVKAMQVQIDWIKWTTEAPSVKRFFPSEYGTDIEYNAESANEAPHQQKLKVRKALREAQNLVHTYVVTGPYADGRNGTFFGFNPARAELGGFDVKGKKAVLTGDGNGKISLTGLVDVGKLTVKALLHPEATKNKALKVNSFTTTGNEIVAEFEKQLGEKWDVSYTSFERLRELEKEAYARKDPAATIFTLRRLWAEGGTLYEKRDNDLIDANDMETLEDAVRASIKAQQSS